MTREAGVLRDAASLERAAAQLATMAGADDPEIRNLVTVSTALVDAARARTESRGTHTRLDFPEPSPSSSAGSCSARPRSASSCPSPRRSRQRGERRRRRRRSACARPSRSPSTRTSGVLGDLTSQAIIPEAALGTGRFVAREHGVLAGTQAVYEVYRQLDPDVTVTWRVQDGDPVAAGHELGRVFGPMRSILSGERTALNFLCHLAGVATLTRRVRPGRGGRGAGPRHAQDAPRAAGAREGGGARRRRPQPPGVPVGRGPDQGQPPRRAGHREVGRRRRATAGRAAPSRSSANGPSRWWKRSRQGPAS